MFSLTEIRLSVAVVLSVASAAFAVGGRPVLQVPGLVQIRDILSQLEAPIVSALTERINLLSDHSLYNDGGRKLLTFLEQYEGTAALTGRFDYGKLEYPYLLPSIPPDRTTKETPFPPGQFHQDSFSGNAELLSFYLGTLVPMFKSPTAYYFHLDNSTSNPNAVFNLDATLLSLISHRAHIGKIVAETKFSSNIDTFTAMIRARDEEGLRAAVTNTTQESGVLSQASNAAGAFANAWEASGALVPGSFVDDLVNTTETLFRRLIDITTDIEVQYLLRRFD